MNKYIFGPVPSRRLGRSLGVDLTPEKTCSLDCRYCQLASTSMLTIERKMFSSPQKIMDELKHTLKKISPPDWITFSGTGEPTLHLGLGELIQNIKKLQVAPLCVITNGTLISRDDVRNELLCADKVCPTLCTVNHETFKIIHRPAREIDFKKIPKGLIEFSEKYSGILEIEIFVCPGINDSDFEIHGLRAFLASLPKLSAVYLNTAVRSPLDRSIKPATPEELDNFKTRLNLNIPISNAFEQTPLSVAKSLKKIGSNQILSLLRRHPCTTQQLVDVLETSNEDLTSLLRELQDQQAIFLDKETLWNIRKTDDYY